MNNLDDPRIIDLEAIEMIEIQLSDVSLSLNTIADIMECDYWCGKKKTKRHKHCPMDEHP